MTDRGMILNQEDEASRLEPHVYQGKPTRLAVPWKLRLFDGDLNLGDI